MRSEMKMITRIDAKFDINITHMIKNITRPKAKLVSQRKKNGTTYWPLEVTGILKGINGIQNASISKLSPQKKVFLIGQRNSLP